MRICFASHNPNKVREIAELAPAGIEIFGLDELNVSEDIPETGTTMEENSSIKARFVHTNFNVPVFADDSGLEVDELNGEPGVYSARYAGLEKSDEKNMDLLLKNLQGISERGAQFKSVITFIDSSGDEKQFDGIVRGEIRHERKGNQGFGYDPIFVPEGHSKTFAEMDSSLKNQLSHRAKAFEKLLLYLQEINE